MDSLVYKYNKFCMCKTIIVNLKKKKILSTNGKRQKLTVNKVDDK